MLQGCAAVSKCLGTRGSKPSHFTSNQRLEGGNRPLRDIHFILSHFFIFPLSVCLGGARLLGLAKLITSYTRRLTFCLSPASREATLCLTMETHAICVNEGSLGAEIKCHVGDLGLQVPETPAEQTASKLALILTPSSLAPPVRVSSPVQWDDGKAFPTCLTGLL